MNLDAESHVRCDISGEETFEYALAITVVIITVVIASHETELVFRGEKGRESVLRGVVVHDVFDPSFRYLLPPINLELLRNYDDFTIGLHLAEIDEIT
jgi:hypothetical protein